MNLNRCIWAGSLFLVAAALLSGCASHPPPLPRRAAIEPGGPEQKFAALLQDADIFYFPSESAAFHSRSEAAWKLLDALRNRGGRFAIGWDWAGNDGDRREYLDEVRRCDAEVLALVEAKPGPQNEAALNADQFVADNIAAYFREHRGDKVLVFLRRERLAIGQGVPYLVAQKTKARQLILNPRKRSDSGAALLASR